MTTYTSLFGTSDINADTVSVQQMAIQSNPLTIGGYDYYFPNINDILITETKTQTLTNKTLVAATITGGTIATSTINSSTIGLTTPAAAGFTDLTASNVTSSTITSSDITNTNITNTYRLQINSQEVVLANLFDKTTDTTDNITEGSTNRFDHITVSTPLVRTADNLTINTANTSQTGALSAADWNTFYNKENALTFSSPLSRVSNTISIPQASASQDGFLSAADFTTFSAATSLWYNVSILGNTRIENSNSLNLKTGTGIFIKTATVSGGIWAINPSNIHTASEFANENSTFTVSTAGATYLSSIATTSGSFCDSTRNITVRSITHTDTSVILSATRDLSVRTGYVEQGFTVMGWTSSHLGYQIDATTVIDSSRNFYAQTLYVNGGLAIDTSKNTYFANISGTNADITGEYRIGGKIAIDTRGTDMVVGGQDLNATIYHFGANNMFIGRDAGLNYLNSGTAGTNNNIVGNVGTGYTLTSGSWNCFFGNYSGYSVSSGLYNTAMGGYSFYSTPAGCNDNTAIGMYSQFSRSSSPQYANTSIGSQSLMYGSGSYNTALGFQAMYSTSSPQYCVAVGCSSALNNSANDIVAVGAETLQSNTGVGNVAMGRSSLKSNTSGAYNTAVGFQSQTNNTTGYFCTSLGYYALGANTLGYSNTAIGYSSLANLSGSNSANTACGYNSLTALSSGNNNAAFGYDAQVASGANLCVVLGSNTYSYGSYNTVLGSGSRAGYNTYQVVLGSAIDVPALSDDLTFGYYMRSDAATVSSGTALYMKTNGRFGPLVSSQKYKTNIRPLQAHIDPFALLNVEPVLYQPIDEPDNKNVVGVIAEQAQEHVPELVMKQKGDPYSFDYPRMGVYLLAVVKSLVDEFEKIKKKLSELEMVIANVNSVPKTYTW